MCRACVGSVKLVWGILAAVAVSVLACSSEGEDAADATEEAASSHGPARDWSAHPAILEIDDADEVFALSDPHGGYEQLGQLLARNGLIASCPSDPDKAGTVRWTGGTATLVVAGDLIDKGSSSLGVIDLLRALQTQAPSKGGRVVVTLGNHEAEFFLDPHNKKADSSGANEAGIDSELQARHIDPNDVAQQRDAAGRGAWLANLPFAVRVKKWFFAHGGNTDQSSIPDLEKQLRSALDGKGWGAKAITGDDSILEGQEWYGNQDKDKTVGKNADALGVKHIVFGHDPGAMKDRGRVLASQDGSLFKLDVNMGLTVSSSNIGGEILHIHTKGTDTFEVLDAQGRAGEVPTTH